MIVHAERIIRPRPLVDAVDDAIGYLYDLQPGSALLLDADCADLFPVTHGHFAGQLFERAEFDYFGAWLEGEVERNPKILAVLDDMAPRIRLTF